MARRGAGERAGISECDKEKPRKEFDREKFIEESPAKSEPPLPAFISPSGDLVLSCFSPQLLPSETE